MTDDKQLNHLIGVLYETVLDPSRWQEAMELFGYYTGGIGGRLATIDKKTKIPIAYVLGAPSLSVQGAADFVDHYFSIDPRSFFYAGEVGEWRCCHHYHDQHFVDRNEFYQDFLIPHTVRYGMHSIVDVDHDHFTTLASLRAVGQQPFSEADQLAAQRFSGHLQRTLRLQKHTQNLQNKAELGARAIDALALSMLIVDGKGVIKHLNAGAEHLLNSA